MLELRAIRTIRLGEEITYAYDNILETYDARQIRYKELHGFVCRCFHCSTHANDPESDNRRTIISALAEDKIASLPITPQEKRKRYEEILEAIEKENLGLYRYHCLVKLLEFSAFAKDIQSAMKWTREVMSSTFIAAIDGVENFEKQDRFSSLNRRIFDEHSAFK